MLRVNASRMFSYTQTMKTSDRFITSETGALSLTREWKRTAEMSILPNTPSLVTMSDIRNV